jgi:Spy/CpxP family protein refolding chaperone
MLLLVAVATTLLLAQGPPDPATMAQHRVDHLTRELNLTDSQQAQATTIFTAGAQSVSAIMDSMRAAHEALDTAVKQNNSAAIDQAATTIGNLTAQLTAAHAKSEAAFLQILTPDQQTKFSQMRHSGPGMMFRRGPGMEH